MKKGAHKYYNMALIKLITSYPPTLHLPQDPGAPWETKIVPQYISDSSSESLGLSTAKHECILKALSRCIVFLSEIDISIYLYIYIYSDIYIYMNISIPFTYCYL